MGVLPRASDKCTIKVISCTAVLNGDLPGAAGPAETIQCIVVPLNCRRAGAPADLRPRREQGVRNTERTSQTRPANSRPGKGYGVNSRAAPIGAVPADKADGRPDYVDAIVR